MDAPFAPDAPPSTAVDRRRLLAALAAAPAAWLASCATPPARDPALAALSTPHGDSPSVQYRLVDRLTWGACDAELDRCARLGTDAWLREQLGAPVADALPAAAQSQLDALSVQRRPLADLLADTERLRQAQRVAVGEEPRKAAQEAYQRELTRLAREAATRHLLRALYSRHALREQMTWFWFNHFNVHQYKHDVRAMLADYESGLRAQALGDFRAMLGAVARHPAMLRYLDNEHNAVNRGNENYARELLELHTLGVDGGYTQRDVQELARVLTGHGVNSGDAPKPKRGFERQYVRSGAYEFNPARHDYGDKTLLGRTIRGRGAEELDEVLDLLAAHPSTARSVCRKMAVALLADDPPQPLVDRMAAAFRGGRIRSSLLALVAAPEFASADVAKFKDPMHYVLSSVRAAYDQRVVLNTVPLQNWLNRLGQGLYNRQTPDGYPLTADAWTGSGQMSARFEFARTLGGGYANLFRADDPIAMPQPPDPPVVPPLGNAGTARVLRASLRDATRQAIDGARSPQAWNALLLSSPDFMYR